MKNYFIGKFCTVLTTPTNMQNLSKAEMANIFTGTLENIDEEGILICGLHGLKSYFNNKYIIGILEEKIVIKNESAKMQKPLSMDALSDLIHV